MQNDLVFPSTALLPMGDIATILENEYNHVYNDKDNPFLPEDTKKVGGEDAKKIAVAVSEKHRDTVEYAQNLIFRDGEDDKDPKILSCKDLLEAKQVQDLVYAINKLCGDEIRDLRDELYMLKSALQKQDILAQVEPYSGFIDVFKQNNIKYTKSLIDNSLKISDVTAVKDKNTFIVTSIEEFKKGDYFIIHLKNHGTKEFEYDKDQKCTGSYDGNYFLEKVVDISEDDKKIVFDRAIEGLEASEIELLKTCGIYYKNTFSNSLMEKEAYDNQQYHTSLLDDTNVTEMDILDSHCGYASTIKVPEENAGLLSTFRVKGQAFGNPGSLVCYVIEEEYIPNFTNKAKGVEDRKIVAQSDFVNANDHLNFGDIVFKNFKDPSTKEPVVLKDKIYCFIISSLGSNGYGDHWSVRVSYHHDAALGNQDVQTNSILYRFKEVPFPATVDKALYTDRNINHYDLYYELITKKTMFEKERPMTKGLYTAKFKLPYPVNVKRGRLTLRINREGLFKTGNKGVTKEKQVFDFVHETNPKICSNNYLYKMNTARLLNTDTLVVGANFVNIENPKDMSASINKTICYNENEPVYRMGYKVQIRPSNSEEEDNNTNRPPVSMNLVSVMPDHSSYNPVAKMNSMSSDRLIFECDLDILDKTTFNEFEVQIAWESGYNIDQLMEYEELAGRIFDLSLSFDRNK